MEVIIIIALVGLAVIILSEQAGGDVSQVNLNLGFNVSAAQLTSDDVRALATNSGFSGSDLDIAVAIAMAESSDESNALGDPTLGVSVGLWQINLRAHPQYSQDELEDPQTNADAAFAIYQAAGNSFHPWSTFTNGAYKKYMVAMGGAGGEF